MKLPCLLASAGILALPFDAAADAGDGYVDAEAWIGRDVVPPDVIDTTADQDRIETEIAGLAEVGYDTGPVLLRGFAGFETSFADSDYNRYTLGVGARYDLPLDKDGRTKLRLQPEYEYVFGNDGKVYGRLRGDVQLIRRHSASHTTTLRLRYGYRNQTEDRFQGYDQGQWLGELRHLWKPSADSSISASLLWVGANAEDDKYSHDGLGFMLIGRKFIRDDLEAYGRVSFVSRNYDDPFSQAYPYAREDDQFRISGGLEHPLGNRLSVFGEAGYATNNSNVPTREYGGFVGRIGIRYRMGFTRSSAAFSKPEPDLIEEE